MVVFYVTYHKEKRQLVVLFFLYLSYFDELRVSYYAYLEKFGVLCYLYIYFPRLDNFLRSSLRCTLCYSMGLNSCLINSKV